MGMGMGMDMRIGQRVWAVCDRATAHQRSWTWYHVPCSWAGLDVFGVVAMLLVLVIWTVFFAYILNDEPGSFGWGFLYGTGECLP